jgi:uncharacterized protein YneR
MYRYDSSATAADGDGPAVRWYDVILIKTRNGGILHSDFSTGLTPEQQQQIAAAQQLAAAYGGGAAGVPMAAPGYAAPTPPMGAVGGGDSTVITANFPDGCLIGYDRLRNELIINGKAANTRMRMMPARPISAAGSVSNGFGSSVAQEEPAEPVEKRGMLTKLGWKKTMLGGDSWQPRYFVLNARSLSYAKDASGQAINTIALNSGIVVNVVSASTPARKNRYNGFVPMICGTLSVCCVVLHI